MIQFVSSYFKLPYSLVSALFLYTTALPFVNDVHVSNADVSCLVSMSGAYAVINKILALKGWHTEFSSSDSIYFT